jgi:glycosyltransferase involved in cell wall biosynthesis
MLKVSIITVCKNSQATIERTIISVLNQTYADIEYIIIDGMSDDHTMDIINKYKSHISKVIHEPDDGIYYAMNKGIEISTGDIIGIINSDDYYCDTEAIDKVVTGFNDSNADIVYGGVYFVSGDGKKEKAPIHELDTFRYQMALLHPGMFVKKQCYQEIGNFNTKYRIAADYDFCLRLYLAHKEFMVLQDYIVCFTMEGVSNTNALSGDRERISIAYENATQEYADKVLDPEFSGIKEDLCFEDVRNGLLKLDAATFFKKITDITHHRDIVVFGAGECGQKCVDMLIEKKTEVCEIWDNNRNKQGKVYQTVNIVAPQANNDNSAMHYFVIIAVLGHDKEINEQMIKLGYEISKDYVFFKSMLDNG